MTTTTFHRPDALRRADGSPVRALVVDDEPTLAELLSTALRYEGWQVEHALPSRAAVKSAKALDPAVIVLCVMPPALKANNVLRPDRPTPPSATPLLMTTK